MGQTRAATPRGYRFGTFKGVFTPSILTVLGVIMYLRLGWVLGNVGLLGTMLIVTLASAITFVTGLSLAALATNMRVGRGGAYFLISRSLGVEWGATVGIPLYFAQALGIAFYVSGFTEALTRVFPLAPPLLVGLGTLAALAVVTALSANLALRLQYAVMILIALSLVSFFAGGPPAPEGLAVAGETASRYPFWMVFAVFFPAVTGIEAGIAMSGDLEDPGRSLPLGTIAAVVVGFLIYLAIPFFLMVVVADPALLRSEPLIMEKVARWGPLVIAGIWAAALSSALGSLLGAPRTLQALAFDRVLPKALARGFGRGNNPLAASAVTFAIALAGVLLGGINAIAPVLSMFFLTSYGILNLSAGIGELVATPSWRPRFRVPILVSFGGFAGCFATMLMINAGATLVAMLVSAGVYTVMKRRAMQVRWGDMRYAALMFGARQIAHRMADLQPDDQTWRPNILVLAGSPAGRWYLVEMAEAISQGRSFLTIITLIPEASWTAERAESIRSSVREYLRARGVQAFVKVFAADDPLVGAQQIVSTYGFGPIVPNTVLLGETEHKSNYLEFARFVLLVHRSRRNLVVMRERRSTAAAEAGAGAGAGVGVEVEVERRRPVSDESPRERIDVWWRGESRNLAFMLALVVLMRRSPSWREAQLFLKIVVEKESERDGAAQRLATFVQEQRVQAVPEVILREGRDVDAVIRESSRGADLVFLGLRSPGEAETAEEYAKYYGRILESTHDLPPTALLMATEQVDFNRIFRSDEVFH